MNPPSQTTESRQLKCRDRAVVIGRETLLVGILNLTPDSFFDGGKFAAGESAIAQASRLVEEGAAIIDVGGQSTRPGYEEISDEEEIARVVPVITALVPRLPVPLSIDTYKPAVARAALQAGAHLINDIYGLQRNPELARLAVEFGCPVVVMHNDAAFREAPGDTIYKIKLFFERSREIAAQAGLPENLIILDPGIGFGKSQEQNLEILARLSELKLLGFPLWLGASRKSVIGNVLALPPEERLEGTLATTALAVWQGVEFIRVHDVRANARAAKMAAAIRKFV
ncbi:MAG TPA: dihydropteroate synthase [Opitutaceae bacterium]|nr:dihydropteroate synthase [Opitutaceae bacterium]